MNEADIDSLSDEARLICGWMINFSWASLKENETLYQAIVMTLNRWTEALVQNGFNVQKACPIATCNKYTFGQLSTSGRIDWAQYARVLERICRKKGCHV